MVILFCLDGAGAIVADPPLEAPASTSVGVVAMSLCGVVFGCIVLFDLVSMGESLRLLRSNLQSGFNSLSST